MIDFEVRPGDAGLRLDRFLVDRLPHLGKGEAIRLIAAGAVRLDGTRARKKGARLRAGQMVSLPEDAALRGPAPEPDLPLEVLAERPDLVVVNKAAGVACHPLHPAERGTVANALVARYPGCADASSEPREAGLVHRLDRCTSGLLLAARDRRTYRTLRDHFSAGRVKKEYLALASGALEREVVVEASVKPRPGDPTRVMAEDEYLPDPAHEARSQVAPVERAGAFTLVRVQSSTGRRHQVRVHLAHLGHPLAGDLLYGGAPLPLDDAPDTGALLHASRVTLPDGGGDFAAPHRWAKLLEELRS